MKEAYVWGVLRLAFGWVFLWAFIDKTFGLGFSTCRDAKTQVVSVMCEKAWIYGGSPTDGFLKFGTRGYFAEFYQTMAGSVTVEWLFMLGILFVGVTLLSGMVVRIGTLTAMVLYVLFYTAGSFLPEHNPFVDEHIIGLLVMTGFFFTNPGRTLGLGKWWEKTILVKKYWFLA